MKLLNMENAKLMVCKDCEKIPTIIAADNFMGVALFPKEGGTFDRKFVISFEPGALAWGGKELYDYYEKNSERVESIDSYISTA